MARLPGRKAIPWMMVLQAAMLAREHWGRLPNRDRDELRRIVAKSRGRPGNLTAHERQELKRLVRALEPIAFGRRLMPFGGGLGRRGRRW
jgi:hypothetical protein